MSNIAELKLNSLDFDYIKQNLIDYYKNDPTFTDYNFEGSGVNILMDILANITHLNGVTANMACAEMFLDSAQLRQSVVSHAKTVGYTPRSCRASMAQIQLTIPAPADSPAYIVIPKGLTFTTQDRIIFSSMTDTLAYPNGVNYTATIDIYEGSFISQKYTINRANPDQRFILNNTGADTNTLTVKIIENTIEQIYYLNKNISLLNSTSMVYFLQQNPDNKFEVIFGDGIIGYQPADAAIVSLEYILPNKLSDANGISIFSKNKNIPYPSGSISNFSITTISSSSFGADQQSTESVRSSANKMYKSQNRAVTTTDYENFIMTEYPFIEDLAVWGGEYNVPPQYGKVFISLKSYNMDKMSNSMKLKIKNDLIKKYNVVTVIPEILDPEYIYISVTTDIDYNYLKTSYTDTELINMIKTNISTYFSENISKFRDSFYISKLTSVIDNTDTSIVGSLTSILLEKRTYTQIGSNQFNKFSFNNEIIPGTLVSSSFNNGSDGEYVKSYYKDNGYGIIGVFNTVNNAIIKSNVGTVNYVSGDIQWTNAVYYIPTDSKDIRFYARPKVENIIPAFNQILKLDDSAENSLFLRKQGINITVNMKVIK